MFPKNKIKIKHLTKLSLILLVPFLFFFVNFKLQADELDDLIDDYCEDASEEDCEDFKDQVDSKESQFDSWENQLKNAEKLLKLKRQQSQTLTNQVNLLNSEISGVQSSINQLTSEINQIQEKIDLLKKEIGIKKENIKKSQTSLGAMLRNYYKLHQFLGLTLISQKDNLTEVFNQSDYLNQMSSKINDTLKIIREEKKELDKKHEEHQINRESLSGKKDDLSQEKQNLALKKNEKNTLLNRTKGEEAQYQALINKIEEQMKQLLIDVDSLSEEKQAELNRIKSDADKPEEGLASTSWHYYQTDNDWADEKLGGSRYTIGDSGCAITSIAMVFTYHDEEIDPEDLADVSSFTNQGYIDWESTTDELDMKLEKNTGHYSGEINWSDLKEYIDDDEPVIVYIRAGSKYGPGHYVVVHGYDDENKDFVVHDPYWGANLLLGTSEDLVEELHDKSTTVDQMIIYKPD